MNLLANLNESCEFIRKQTQAEPKVGITLGSGLSSFVGSVNVTCKIPYETIPHFSPPTVDGHPGAMIFAEVGGKEVVILQGRIHFYEGHSMQQVVYPTRVLGSLGIEKFIVTNAAGGADPNMQPGDFMIIEDQMNLTGTNALIGPNEDSLGPRFPDMSQAFDREMIQVLEKILAEKSIRFSKGVYCGLTGPTYETPAEVRYVQAIGGNAVGMSTVNEVIAAKHMGLRVCGISCITNMASGLSDTPITHEEVKEIGQRVEKDFSAFLLEFVSQL